MRQLLEAGEAGLSFARACVAGGKWRVALATVKLLAPIYDPEKIVCVGLGSGLGLGLANPNPNPNPNQVRGDELQGALHRAGQGEG